jgi:hypothetical protein
LETFIAIGAGLTAMVAGNGAGVANTDGSEHTADQTAGKPLEDAAARRDARERPCEIIEPLSVHPRLSSTTQ